VQFKATYILKVLTSTSNFHIYNKIVKAERSATKYSLIAVKLRSACSKRWRTRKCKYSLAAMKTV